MTAVSVEPLYGCAAHQNNASIMRRDMIESLIAGQDRREDAEHALDAMQRYGSPQSAQIAGRIPEHIPAAQRMLRELGRREDASSRVNFAYAIAAVGPERTRELHEKLGIENFMRYSRSMLLEIYNNMHDERSSQPLLVAAFNKNDWNGAFYREGHALDPLMSSYRVVLFETATEGEFHSRLEEISRSYGQISVMVVGGHGNPSSVQLGENNDSGNIDNGDENELSARRGLFVRRPMVVLVACSTGESDKAIGAHVSRALGARVFAPVTPSSRTVYHLDQQGYLVNVTYNVETRSFVDGVAR